MGALPFIIRAKQAGAWARTKDYLRDGMGIDGIEILEGLEVLEEEGKERK